MARQSPGYVFVKELIADAIMRRATRIMLDYSKESVDIRYDVDGLWHPVEPRDRETGDVTLAVMKKISALNMEERRRTAGRRVPGEVRSAASTPASSSVREPRRVSGRSWNSFPQRSPSRASTIWACGKRCGRTQRVPGEPRGMVVFSALPLGGLQTSWNVGITATDRYLRDFAAIEDKAHPFTHVENVEVFPFDGAGGRRRRTRFSARSPCANRT